MKTIHQPKKETEIVIAKSSASPKYIHGINDETYSRVCWCRNIRFIDINPSQIETHLRVLPKNNEFSLTISADCNMEQVSLAFENESCLLEFHSTFKVFLESRLERTIIRAEGFSHISHCIEGVDDYGIPCAFWLDTGSRADHEKQAVYSNQSEYGI